MSVFSFLVPPRILFQFGIYICVNRFLRDRE